MQTESSTTNSFCDLFTGKRLFRNNLGEISIRVNNLFDNSAVQYSHSVNASGEQRQYQQGSRKIFFHTGCLSFGGIMNQNLLVFLHVRIAAGQRQHARNDGEKAI